MVSLHSVNEGFVDSIWPSESIELGNREHVSEVIGRVVVSGVDGKAVIVQRNFFLSHCLYEPGWVALKEFGVLRVDSPVSSSVHVFIGNMVQNISIVLSGEDRNDLMALANA